jgi:hypothetical protein
MTIKSRNTLGSLIVVFLVVGCLSGCAEREEGAVAESNEAVSEPAASAPMTEAVEPRATAPAEGPASLESFLARRVRMRPIAAGQEIRAFFASWEQMLTRRSREPVDVHFEVDAEGTFGKEHRWTASTNRGILDELALEYDLAWTIAEPNTIRITREGAL